MKVMSESDNVRSLLPQKKKKKKEISKKKKTQKKKKKSQKNEISNKTKSKNIRTQLMSVSDNI